MGIDLSGTTPADPSRPKGILELIQEGIAGAGGIGAVLAGAVTGIVGGLVGAVQGIAGLIGGLFSLGRQDTARVDAARVAGENAIVENMSESLEHLDEIQRVGGAFMGTPAWTISNGERNPHPLPVNDDVPLSQGTIWHPPSLGWGTVTHHANGDADRGWIAQRSGVLELAEPGLWMIYFQASVLQGSAYPNDPADVWCYVRNTSTTIPVGTPRNGMDAYNRVTGAKSSTNLGDFHTYGRAGAYVGVRDTGEGGGNTVSGYFMCYLETPGWFITMSASAYKHFGGAASTFVFAQKVNSEDLRDDIEDLKDKIAAALPGENVPLDLDDAQIAAMVAEADAIDVLSEAPDE